MSLPPNKKLLSQYPNKFFVETGSYRGDAIQQAIEANYYDIRSIDNDGLNIDFCKNRFNLHYHPEHRNIKLYLGDSSEILQYVIADIQTPITFWLDAHSQYLEDELEMPNPFPLLDELQQIANHPIDIHNILIDDILILTHPKITGWSLDDIINILHIINPAYKIDLVPNPVKDNLLIAHF